MRLAIGIAVLVVLALGLHLVVAWRAQTRVTALADALRAESPRAPRADLPPEVAAFARRGLAGGAADARLVTLTQKAEMDAGAGKPWRALAARQSIGTARSGFVWEAWQKVGPLTLVRVVDAFVAGRGLLRVRIGGSVPVMRAEGGDYDRGEAMRYLAELPWAPDAIWLNRDLKWQVEPDGRIRVSLPVGAEEAVVWFTPDANGDWSLMEAPDRPADDGQGGTVLKEWRGTFTDWGEIGGRRIPRRGEIAYMEEGTPAPYWRGRITGYEVLR